MGVAGGEEPERLEEGDPMWRSGREEEAVLGVLLGHGEGGYKQ